MRRSRKSIKIVDKLNDSTDLDLYDLEDILEELKALEGKNRFQEGDIISKSSNKRVKRKSGKLKSNEVRFIKMTLILNAQCISRKNDVGSQPTQRLVGLEKVVEFA